MTKLAAKTVVLTIFWRWHVLYLCVSDWPAAWPVHEAAAPAASPGVSAPPPADAWCTPVNQSQAQRPVSFEGIQRKKIKSGKTSSSFSSYTSSLFQISFSNVLNLSWIIIWKSHMRRWPQSTSIWKAVCTRIYQGCHFFPLLCSFIYSHQAKLHCRNVYSLRGLQ